MPLPPPAKAAPVAPRPRRAGRVCTLTCPTLTLLLVGTSAVTTLLLLSVILPWFTPNTNSNDCVLAASRAHFFSDQQHHANNPHKPHHLDRPTTTNADHTAGTHTRGDTTTVTPHDLPRILAIYFPQFHPDPLNDRLWGQNFTDWTSLQAAPAHNRYNQPLPHPLPTSGLGYYDLRETAVRQRQGALAQQYRVDGFVMHHYWFYDPTHPGPTLQAPLEAMLHDQAPNISFLFNWCAAPWSSLWTGQAQAQQQKRATQNNPIVLQPQYWPTPQTNLTALRHHWQWLRQFFILPNYIRVGGHPVLMMYQYFPQSLPILRQFRQWAQQDAALGRGLTIWMSRSATHPDLLDISALTDREQRIWKRKSQQKELLSPVSDTAGPVWNATVAYPYMHDWSVQQGFQIPGWCQRQPQQSSSPIWASPEIPGVLTSFDNTPRRQADQAKIWNPKDSTPTHVVERFQQSLAAAVYYETCCRRLAVNAAPPPSERFVIINAWNEWAEGMAMEPSTVYGTGFLQAVRTVQENLIRQGCVL